MNSQARDLTYASAFSAVATSATIGAVVNVVKGKSWKGRLAAAALSALATAGVGVVLLIIDDN